MRLVPIITFVASALGVPAQTGPAGIGNSSSNALWLSADRSVYNNASGSPAANGDNVQQWGDRSGNGKTASENTVANRPNYYTNVVNGLPVIRYTAANTDHLQATGLSAANKASVWVVARYTSLPSSNPGLIQGAATGNAYSNIAGDKNIGIWVNSTNTQVWGRGIQTNTTQVNIPQTTNLNNNTFYIITTEYDGANVQQYVNNSAAGSVAYNGTLASWTDMAIGAQAGTEGWNGDIAEVLVYNNSLNSAQRIIMANYLAAKYGMTLGANDIYVQDNAGNGNYDHEVAGIGRVNATNLQNDSKGPGLVQINNPSDLGDNEFLIWGHDNGTLGVWGVTDKPASVQGRWARVWRVNEVSAAGAAVDVGNIDIIFDLTGLGPVTASHLRLLIDTNNDGLFSNETPISGAVSLGSGRYRFAGVSQISNNRRFTLGTTNIGSTPLPIELISFKASLAGPSTVFLEWSTATEHDNDYFTVERSTDLVEWTDIAYVASSGNSTSLTEYSTYDVGVPDGLYYYRLRQTDLDGTYTFSDIVTVDLGIANNAGPIVFPNPNEGSFSVSFPKVPSGPVTFTLVDMAGRSIMRTVHTSGSGQYLIDTDAPAPGLYQLHIQDGTTNRVNNVWIQH